MLSQLGKLWGSDQTEGADEPRLESTRQRAGQWCRQGVQQHGCTGVAGTWMPEYSTRHRASQLCGRASTFACVQRYRRRRVASWEHDAKETLSDLIKIGVVIKGLEKGVFFGSFVDQHCWAMGSQDQKLQGNCSWCGIYGRTARDCGKKTEYLQNNETS